MIYVDDGSKTCCLVIRTKWRPTTECIDSISVKFGLNWYDNNPIFKILKVMEFPFLKKPHKITSKCCHLQKNLNMKNLFFFSRLSSDLKT